MNMVVEFINRNKLSKIKFVYLSIIKNKNKGYGKKRISK
jgi:hypothetical protein